MLAIVYGRYQDTSQDWSAKLETIGERFQQKTSENENANSEIWSNNIMQKRQGNAHCRDLNILESTIPRLKNTHTPTNGLGTTQI